MFDTPERRRAISKWVIGTVTCCVLIYLGLRHISSIAQGFSWLAGLAKPLLIGGILALVLNVPLRQWEAILRGRTALRKAVRPLAIFLSLVSVLGIFAGIAFLIIPELADAVQLVVQILGSGLEQLAQMERDEAQTSLDAFISGLGIDWLDLKQQMENWFKERSGALVEQIFNATKKILSSAVTLLVGLFFSVYLLSGKEKLKRQACRLVRVWLPQNMGGIMIHISSVCGDVFHRFVAGQFLEALILGTLCMLGMVILRIPYAPMVGVLIGVTALIPVVGAFAGTIVGAVMIMTVSPLKAVVFVIFLLILQQVEGNLIYPRVVGAKINLPAIWVLAAVTVGGNLAGPLGMFLGVPAASATYTLIREATDRRERKRSMSASADSCG
ncbi:AI-2E family transporter [Dysosmobacter sp.]|jgi:predicted PurR-regulated permease PerM|uniref:AI-2E family transporter n=1 Tax=Dysosmobacter sp. TaxID=2591382 RepID=UPI003D8AEDCE